MSKTVLQAQLEKYKLEKELSALVMRFEDETGLEVSELRIGRTHNVTQYATQVDEVASVHVIVIL